MYIIKCGYIFDLIRVLFTWDGAWYCWICGQRWRPCGGICWKNPQTPPIIKIGWHFPFVGWLVLAKLLCSKNGLPSQKSEERFLIVLLGWFTYLKSSNREMFGKVRILIALASPPIESKRKNIADLTKKIYIML